jgi:hypothetical protein
MMKPCLKIWALLMLVMAKGFSFAQGVGYATEEELPRLQLFNVTEYQKNHRIHIQLPEDASLCIEFLRLSDWGSQHELPYLTDLASKQVNSLLDSFKNTTSAKILAMNLPSDGQVISLALSERNLGETQLAFKDNEYYQLKTSFDTIRIVRNEGVRRSPAVDSGLIQVCYTFSLKNLSDISKLANNTALWSQVGDSIDSKIALYRSRWKNPDAQAHQLTMYYNAQTESAVGVDARSGALFPALRNKIAVYVGVGGILHSGGLAPMIDLSFAYVFPGRGKQKAFLGFNMHSFSHFDSNLKPQVQYSAINAELGTFRNNRGLMQAKTSIGYGVLVRKPEHEKARVLFNMVLNWGVTSYMTVGLNAASTLNFDKSKDIGLMGVQLKFNL